MKFIKLNTTKLVNVNIQKYKIDWNRKVSAPQKKVKDFLFPFWSANIVLEEFIIPGSKFRIDLLNLTHKIAIEVSPRALHVNYNKFMHGNRVGFLDKLKADTQKMVWAENNGFKFIELYDEEINNLSKNLFEEKFGVIL